MTHNTEEQAQLLVEALPYIQKYYGKTIVIKYGGHAMTSEDIKASVIKDILLMRLVGMRPILVHGGGPDINRMMDMVGLVPEFVDGKRVTDSSTMEIVEMVLAGKTNKSIVGLLNSMGGNAVGLSGKDGNLISASQLSSRLGRVGRVDEINPRVLYDLLDNGYIPVISSIGMGDEGEAYNINADHIAGEVAAAVKAEKLIMMTDVDGIYRDIKDPSTFVSRLTAREAGDLIGAGLVSKGMIPKVEACIIALEAGVEGTHIINGTKPHSILMEVLTDSGIGTMIEKTEE
ncbi:MAG: acetylglutamate kinase [Abditibacteriota bacterium]|nr:acetylglutamate kinase [Abditibacteriota bacterium]